MLFDRGALSAQKDFQCLKTLSFERQIPQGASFVTEAGSLEISFYGHGIIRLRSESKKKFDYGLLVSPPESTETSFSQGNGFFKLESENIAVDLSTNPLRLKLAYKGRVILESSTDMNIQSDLRLVPLAHGDDQWFLSFALGNNEPVYGLGEKFSSLNRRGQLVNSWNEDALGVSSELSYKNTPFAWSPNGWGIFVHTPSHVTNGVGYPQWSHRSYILKIDDPNLDIFFMIGDKPADILRKYTFLTGRAPHLPRWSYGIWMSRAYYHTAEEVLKVAHTLRDHKIPSDILLLDGRAWHKMEYRFDFKWDEERYPDPVSFIQKLRDLNFRLCLWEYPYISVRNPLFEELAEKGYLLCTTNGKPYIHNFLAEPNQFLIPQLQPSGIIDLTNPDAYIWYRDSHRDLFAAGVSVMKTDFGEAVPEDVIAYNGDTGKRLHNVYSLLYNRCAFEATEKFSSDLPVVWGRSGWTGSQRYPVQWGGDPSGDWEGLTASIHGGLSWGMSGSPFYAHDIGGFGGFGGSMPETELYVRWAQAGVMSSHTRFHGTSPREPWEYGEEAECIIRQWLEWRYRLIPYLESCALEANRTGLPVMRAMPLAFPDDSVAWQFEEQYMLGPVLMVVPVVSKGGHVFLYLPKGNWYDIWTGKRLKGPRVLQLTMPLDKIPIYGREGFVLPLGHAVQHTGQMSDSNLINELFVFGIPRQSMEVTGLLLKVDAQINRTVLTNLPAVINLHLFGDILIMRTGENVIFAPRGRK